MEILRGSINSVMDEEPLIPLEEQHLGKCLPEECESDESEEEVEATFLPKKPTICQEITKRLKEFYRKPWYATLLGVIFFAFASLWGLNKKFPYKDGFLAKWDTNPFVSFDSWDRVGLFIALLGTAIISFPGWFWLFVRTSRRKAGKTKHTKNPVFHFFGFLFVIFISLVSLYLGANKDLSDNGLSYEVWSVMIGLILSNLLSLFFKVFYYIQWRRGGKATEEPKDFSLPFWIGDVTKLGEDFIKIALVLLGIDLQQIASLGVAGMLTTWLIVPFVIVWMMVISNAVPFLRIRSKSLLLMLVAATSICGASAATAVQAAINGPTKELTLVISIVYPLTIVQMFVNPRILMYTGLPKRVIAAWLGGTIDATGCVIVSASFLDDDDAVTTASTVKIIQNIAIGVVAVIMAIYWMRYEKKKGLSEGEGTKIVFSFYDRFPKFVVGFFLVSAGLSIYRATFPDDTVDGVLYIIKSFSALWFAMGFTSIGFSSNFFVLAKDLKGAAPILLYLVGQLFDMAITLFASLLFFGELWKYL
eukprot:CAMPEP_0174270028 /NCGR_PEP_ID=MMETSP0439-20130205/43032_1 /TAXON_ID=0 /ORGANISM="Stereomyxa ramosa, Strain Chinc5" /LENGTH=531 /DNA_ID=CAMNT_0015359103 /DNA_START=69 /DNA_END=1661 /DNA_ORIENTATION=-